MKVVAALGVLVLLLLATPAVSQTPDDKLIVAGQRIGKWTLEMTIETLLQMNGPRNVDPGLGGTPLDPMRRWQSDSDSAIWWHLWFNLLFSAATRGRDAQRVEYIFIESDQFKTDKGIAVGVGRQAVENAHGQPTAMTRIIGGVMVGSTRLIYDELGLAALIDRNGVVGTLIVFRPRTARTLWNF